MNTLLPLIPLAPLAGFLVNFLLAGRLSKKAVSFVACGSVFVSLTLSVKLFFDLLALPAEGRVIKDVWFDWVTAGTFSADFSFLLDPLSAVMILVVSGVGFLIHVYSIGYMSHDPGYGRYFSYLNLFTFSMLTLVLAGNFLLMFVGWEGVGLCSYLLIGFWFERQSAADAGKKAFIVNRIGDFGMLLGMFIIFWAVGSLDFQTVMARAPEVFAAGGALVTAATLMLFLGATGKSAQIPLHIWLPDAMEGPTPVSALIHAATMVTAGVYLLARTSTLFVMAPTTLMIVAIVGCATAFFAATIGMLQNDIKRVLAYSTVSQLGYMFMACGVAAFGVGIFHLMTHAFFKALLFLGAGSVIHAMSDEQDMRKMGGLKKYLPTTYLTFLIATLAISGIPGMSGFFSKDEILWRSFSSAYGHPVFWVIGLITALLTAFYMFRVVYMTFFGKERMDDDTRSHLHESPGSMTAPLVILAVLSVIGGWIGIPHIFGATNHFEHWLAPVFARTESLMSAGAPHGAVSTEWTLMVASVVLIIGSIVLARHYFLKHREAAERIRESFAGVYRLLYGKYFIDELYHRLIIRPIHVFSLVLWRIVDVVVIDGLINGGAYLVGAISSALRLVQSGKLPAYATVFTIGVLILAGVVALVYVSGSSPTMLGQG
ncbi:MAG: NADH-quinone oxidoreductase subunit L [Candidatus Zixiibacteriota bacterium]